MSEKVYGVCDSPLGKIYIYIDKHEITQLSFKKLLGSEYKKSTDHSLLLKAQKQLGKYFKGELKEFNLPLGLKGTPFQKKTWKVLTKIPFGETWSYKKEAIKLGDAKKARAVGSANGKNPIPIIVPCHRVVASDGGLGGYSLGLDKKIFLLDLESNSL